jgi:hypothetical protein
MPDIIFLLDESTSMKPHAKSYIKGVNTFLTTQKQTNPYSNFTMIKFSSKITTLCVDSKIHTLSEFTSEFYKPDGLTALYDAIGHAIKLKHTNSVTNSVIIILTDGDDNHSKNYTLETIAQKILYMQRIGWVFVYIAANQNAQIMGEKLGIGTCLTYNETEKSIADVSDACSIAIGHAIYNWSGVQNQYCDQEMPTDVSDLMEEMGNISI